jgi:formiminoglutamase
MSAASTSVAAPSTRFEPYRYQPGAPPRPDDPRLGECVTFSTGDPVPLSPGQPVVIGFPQDEGVRRNFGRPGAAEAPREIRRWLYRLSPWDVLRGADLTRLRLLDLGDLRCDANLEAGQQALGEVVAKVLAARAVPVVLGGGHETAFGHFLGYAASGGPVGIINLDAHLDVRPTLTPTPLPSEERGGKSAPLSSEGRGVGGEGLGHSGSPFRQAMEFAAAPLRGERYACLGVQPHSVSRDHLVYVLQRGATVRWSAQVRDSLCQHFNQERERLTRAGCPVYVSLDADVANCADVPGVSAPNPLGLSGAELIACARLAGESPNVTSFDVVEVNPAFDRDGHSARWAALVVWYFLVGLAQRSPER